MGAAAAPAGTRPAEMTISLVVAAAENGIIGANGRMPWRLPSDLRRFRSLTFGRPVIMGRKTFQSIGKPLDGRLNIVISGSADFAAPGAVVVPSLDAAIDHARRHGQGGEIMVIGGADVYRQALPRARRIYLTRVHAQPEGDTIFQVPPDGSWAEISSTPLPRGENDEFACTLIVLERSDAP